ncbi:MAG: class I SAM-dependent methyltransferase [Spirochaetales bacterium]|nr:class I SAM-dependent methyltransferase [Spirochaetales bacterium]MCF7938070.1 class I SAM-dependent methyltransferase [Spirochaetales bacterium]
MHPLKSILQAEKVDIVLDVATGSGKFIPLLSNSFASWKEIIGIDAREKVLNSARQNVDTKGVRFITASADRLPFDTETVSSSALSNSLHHLENPRTSLEEMYRVLCPGGIMIINEMFTDIANKKQETFLQFHQIVTRTDQMRGEYHVDLYNRDQILELITEIPAEPEHTVIYNEDDPDYLERPDPEDFKVQLTGKIKPFKGSSEYAELEEAVASVTSRMDTIGIQKPSELIVVLRKPE